MRLIDIKEAVCVDTLKLPLLSEKIVQDHNHLLSAEPSKKFLQVGDELFAVIQNDSDKPLQIFRYVRLAPLIRFRFFFTEFLTQGIGNLFLTFSQVALI